MSAIKLTTHELHRDWQYEVANGDTVLGFVEWLEHWIEANEGQNIDKLRNVYSRHEHRSA